VSFIALLLAFSLERLLAARLHIREPGWLLGYVRASLRLASRQSSAAGQASLAAALALAPGIAVAIVAALFARWVHGAVWVALAAVVLFYSLGPRDLREEVREYCAAAERGDTAEAARLAAGILEEDARQRSGAGLESVAEAIFVQANNRQFGVLFWFGVLGLLGALGPLGALAFRITDLMRREAIQRAQRADAPAAAVALSGICQRLHGVLAFLPARLLALTYGLAGSFEASFAGWRGYLRSESDHFFDANDRLLVHAGRGALGAAWQPGASEAQRARAALALTEASLYVWVTGLAVLTLVAWIA
jgi:AmpE protein